MSKAEDKHSNTVRDPGNKKIANFNYPRLSRIKLFMGDKTIKQYINRPDNFFSGEDSSKEVEKTSKIMGERLKIINFLADEKISEKKKELSEMQSLLDEFDLYSSGKLDISIDEADKKFKNLDAPEDDVRKKIFGIEEDIAKLEMAKETIVEHYDEIAADFENAYAIDADGSFEKFVEEYLSDQVNYKISEDDFKEIIEKRRN